MHRFTCIAVFLLVGCIGVPSLHANVRLPHFFGDHMVLQRERAAAVWGAADPGAVVKVTFKGRIVETRADAAGRWKTKVETGAADANGATLTISSNGETVVLKDVLVGEVWFASGQSNMVFRTKQTLGADEFVAQADFPGVRFFDGPNVTATEPQTDIEGTWEVCSPATVGNWSGVASYFAIKLHRELGIPIGIIESSWGGKPIEAFTSREALNTLPESKLLVDALFEADRSYDEARAQVTYQKDLANWNAQVAAAKSQGKKLSARLRKPDAPKRPLNTERNPGVLFDAMIHPFIGYSIRGAIWYQGEGNARYGAVPYDQTLPLLIEDWRKRWGDEFSFYFVQLANYHAPTTEPGVPDAWPLLQDRMRRVLSGTPKTGMAVINDVGDAKDIHPKDKRTPGERLARWALAKDYGRTLVWSSPLYKSSEIKGSQIIIHFEHVGEGLRARDSGPLRRFEIAGEDKKWRWAEAEVAGKDSVAVHCADVLRPVAVRYAWAANPEGANLVNSDGLPASVFRTDDWSDAEPPPPPSLERTKKLAEIRALGEKLKSVNAKSDEGRALKTRLEAMLKEFKATAPQPTK